MKQWKILYFDLTKVIKNDIIWGLLDLQLSVRRSEYRVPDTIYTEEELEKTLQELGGEDLVISQDFSAVVAEACHQRGLIYLSWVYDSPQMALFMKEALYDTNRIFAFDRMQQKRMKEQGLLHVYYQPMAANIGKLGGLVIEDEEIESYRTDILFVGNFYQDEGRSAYLSGLPRDIHEEVEKVLSGIYGTWEGKRWFHPMDEQIVCELKCHLKQAHLDSYRIDPGYLIETLILARELTSRERMEMLQRLSKQYEVTCYSAGTDPEGALSEVRFRPPIEGEEEVFKAYYSAKINLNHTLTSIETGVPLRVFDILGVGGFVLSNDQEELHELFEVDKELVTFSSFEEMEEKAAFYLRHDDLRIRIGIAGYERVRDCYTYPIAMKTMLDTVEKEIA